MRKTAILLAATLVTAMGLGAGGTAAGPGVETKPGSTLSAAGIVTDIKPDFVMLWVDGEDAPAKFALAESFDKTTFGFPPKCKGVFNPDRVQFTYVKGDDGNKVLAMALAYKSAPPQPAGTVTGEVLFSDDFWVAVKPKNGPLDGYAIGWPPGPVHETLKTLKKGDFVTIKFHTDVERHRMDALAVVPKPADPPVAQPPTQAAKPPDTATPAAPVATSQPAQSPEEQARARLQLVQMYLDGGMKDKAKAMLTDIIRQYPNTEAAKTAKTKLTALGGG